MQWVLPDATQLDEIDLLLQRLPESDRRTRAFLQKLRACAITPAELRRFAKATRARISNATNRILQAQSAIARRGDLQSRNVALPRLVEARRHADVVLSDFGAALDDSGLGLAWLTRLLPTLMRGLAWLGAYFGLRDIVTNSFCIGPVSLGLLALGGFVAYQYAKKKKAWL